MQRSEAEDFLYQEARLLDAGRLRDWQKLFTDDAIYWVPSNKRDYDPKLHISFIYDNMDLLNERLGRLEGPACYAQQPPSSTLHQISNVTVAEATADRATITSNLALFEYRNNTQRRFYPMQIFPAHCEHHLQRTPEGWKIRLKKVTLLNCDGEILDLTFIL